MCGHGQGGLPEAAGDVDDLRAQVDDRRVVAHLDELGHVERCVAALTVLLEPRGG